YPEANPFSDSTGSASSGLEWIRRFLKHETTSPDGDTLPAKIFLGDGASLPKLDLLVDIVVTDPPYFDEISYADLSDHFYVWQKRALGDLFPTIFATPQTPKSAEATSLKHRHKGSETRAYEHFTSKLAECLVAAKRQCKADGIIAVMFAHQYTDAWSALIHAL